MSSPTPATVIVTLSPGVIGPTPDGVPVAMMSPGSSVMTRVMYAIRKSIENTSCAVVESTKAASDVYAPLSGEVVAANEDLGANPGDVNASPYEKGWLFKLKLKNRAELGELMARDEYAKAAGV